MTYVVLGYCRYECDNEKARREKAEKKVEELREELRQMKAKVAKAQEEGTSLRNENIEFKNQLEGFKSKIHLIADRTNSEAEKNQALQDELSDVRKKLELSEVKCANYSDKFDLLLKKYDTRKIRQKSKVERLW
jgi:chromosome segregation ATPase